MRHGGGHGLDKRPKIHDNTRPFDSGETVKKLNIIVVILMVAAVVAGGSMAARSWRNLRAAKSAVAEYDRQIAGMREQRAEATFKYRGVQESMEQVPDSSRAEMIGQYMSLSRKYQKQIGGHEREIRKTERVRKKSVRALDQARTRFVLQSTVTGLVVVILGWVLYLRREIRS